MTDYLPLPEYFAEEPCSKKTCRIYRYLLVYIIRNLHREWHINNTQFGASMYPVNFKWTLRCILARLLWIFASMFPHHSGFQMKNGELVEWNKIGEPEILFPKCDGNN